MANIPMSMRQLPISCAVGKQLNEDIGYARQTMLTLHSGFSTTRRAYQLSKINRIISRRLSRRLIACAAVARCGKNTAATTGKAAFFRAKREKTVWS